MCANYASKYGVYIYIYIYTYTRMIHLNIASITVYVAAINSVGGALLNSSGCQFCTVCLSLLSGVFVFLVVVRIHLVQIVVMRAWSLGLQVRFEQLSILIKIIFFNYWLFNTGPSICLALIVGHFTDRCACRLAAQVRCSTLL